MKYIPLEPDPVGIWYPMLVVKETPPAMPEKYPKKQESGPKMDYVDVAFPKPKKKKKKGRKK